MIIIERILLPMERWWTQAIERDIAFLKLDVRAFRADLKVVNERILPLQRSTGTLESDVARLTGKVDAKPNAAITSGRLDVLEARVDALSAKVDAILAQVTRIAAIANPSRTS